MKKSLEFTFICINIYVHINHFMTTLWRAKKKQSQYNTQAVESVEYKKKRENDGSLILVVGRLHGLQALLLQFVCVETKSLLWDKKQSIFRQ